MMAGAVCSRFPVLVPDVTADTALSLEGKGRLDYHVSPSRKRDALMRLGARGQPGVERLEVKFMTRSESGVLLHIQESSNFTTVKVRLQLRLVWFGWAASCFVIEIALFHYSFCFLYEILGL